MKINVRHKSHKSGENKSRDLEIGRIWTDIQTE